MCDESLYVAINLNKAMLHTDTHKHTYTDTESALRTPVRESQPQEKPEPTYPKMEVEGRPQFRLTDSHTPLFHPVTSALLPPGHGTPWHRHHSTTRQQQRERGVQCTLITSENTEAENRKRCRTLRTSVSYTHLTLPTN